MEFLTGSPFSSPVGQRIQRATSSALQAEDWGLNMEICDIINETDDGPKDAVKALKKRIVGNKNFREVMLALTVLEACVKNCGHRFHVLVCTKDFAEGVLVRAILPKNNPPMILHDRILSLIQAWADAFRNSPSLSGVVSVYDDLRKRGLEFPMTDLDALSPIHTPNRSIPENEMSVTSSPVSPVPSTDNISQILQLPQTGDGPVSLSTQQKQKLNAELDVVKGNLTVMTQMLNHLTPGESQPSDTELLQQLYSVCKDMQNRVMELIPKLAEDALIGQLLSVNDELNNAFIRYERFERLHRTQKSTKSEESSETGNLIDLSPVSEPTNQKATNPAMSQPAVNALLSQTEDDDEFDMFAQTRASSLAEQRKSVRYEDPGAVEGLAEALDTRLQVTGAVGMPDLGPGSDWMFGEGMTTAPRSSAMDEIEKWLSSEVHEEPGEGDGLTSEEFDKFLEKRVKRADRLPSVHKDSSTNAQQLSESAQKEESSHDQLFKL
ncbi:target of Myb protein 1 isoform X2 [Chanos chanos]|uniref:Target of Myb protein 1 isoform X2 n=1 Tax=Chanos chanos TaxID=29144 RepID=A0A6J2W2E9_CHACN|nr:target of Myb protein 1-like isoform X2 [Chanos chanos]